MTTSPSIALHQVVRNIKQLEKFKHTRKIKRTKKETIVCYALIYQVPIARSKEQSAAIVEKVKEALTAAGHPFSNVVAYEYTIDIYQTLPPDEDGTLINSFLLKK